MNTHLDWTHLLNNVLPNVIKLPGVMDIVIFNTVTIVTRVTIQLWLVHTHTYSSHHFNLLKVQNISRLAPV